MLIYSSLFVTKIESNSHFEQAYIHSRSYSPESGISRPCSCNDHGSNKINSTKQKIQEQLYSFIPSVFYIQDNVQTPKDRTPCRQQYSPYIGMAWIKKISL